MEPNIVTPAKEIEIHWGGRIFRFRDETEALKAGFHLKDPNQPKEPKK